MNDSPLSAEQLRLLRAIGLRDDQAAKLAESSEFVVFQFMTEAEPGIGMLQITNLRLRCGVVYIHDEGGGIKSLLRLKQAAADIARAFGLAELEVFGAALINQRLKAVLERRGFATRVEPCPEDLGGGTMEILSRTELLVR